MNRLKNVSENRVEAIILCIALFSGLLVSAQPSNDNCSSATEVCANQIFSLTNIGASASVCANCEDDFNYCFDDQNSIWMTFTTNALGGDIQVDFSNLVFALNPGQDNELQATIIQAATPCDASTYTQIGNCVSNAAGNFSLNAIGLPALTKFYIVVDGDNTGAGVTSAAECSFDLILSGTGIDRTASLIAISPQNGTYCLNEIVTFNATISDCPDPGNYEWYINGVLAGATVIPVFQTTALVDGDVVSVQTSCYLLCPETVSDVGLSNSVISFPVDAGANQTISPGSSATLNGSTTAGSIVWSPSQSLSDPSSLNPSATPSVTTTYTLSATQLGCTINDQVTISLESEIFIPTTFSPNDDNINETWIIEGMEDYPNASVKVFSRWGQEVFESTGYSDQKAWKGDSKRGQLLASGVYYYIIDLKGEDEEVLKGSVTIIR